MDPAEVGAFVAGWLEAWNRHDLEAILAHFAGDVVFTSPVAIQLLDGSDGVIRGKPALRDYWAEGLRRLPDLHFELVAVYAGVATIAINYRNERGGLVNEVLTFDGAVVVRGDATYEAV